MAAYPVNLIQDYRAGKISRNRFIYLFRLWQRENRHTNYNCEGYATSGMTFVAYRGEFGKISKNKILWQKQKISSVFDFERQVDFYLRKKPWK